MSKFARGSEWHRWDLHFHTPSSYDYEIDEDNPEPTNQELVDGLVEAGIRVVAITDHHVMDEQRILAMQELGKGKLTVLPGIELRDDHGAKPIHYICIFPETANVEHICTTMRGTLRLHPLDIVQKGGDEAVYTPIEDAFPLVRSLGGIITIHAGGKNNSLKEIEHVEQFQQRLKLNIVNDYVDILEVGNVKTVNDFRNKVFRDTGIKKPLIICSDNHCISKYSAASPTWFKADPTFRGLLMVLREPDARVYVGNKPLDAIKVEQNKSKYIKRLVIKKVDGSTCSEKWFKSELPLNHGLIAIVGNKGSGKSALADVIGLLGNSQKFESFSFLNKERFRHVKSGQAKHFEASLEWENGDIVRKNLDDRSIPDRSERVKYLPQDHVEDVCNELTSLTGSSFERELKAVIFSHVNEAERLGQRSLDDLVSFKTDEKQRRIDSLVKQLKEKTRQRVRLEKQSDPSVKTELQAKLERRRTDLNIHNQQKPETVEDPSEDPANKQDEDDVLLLKALQQREIELNTQIESAENEFNESTRKRELAARLIERLENFVKESAYFISSISDDADELGITASSLVELTVKTDSVSEIEKLADERISASELLLDGIDPPGLIAQLDANRTSQDEVRNRLGAPARIYQEYKEQLAEWETKRLEIIGDESDPDSITGIQSEITALTLVPAQIAKFKEAQLNNAIQIMDEKLSLTEVFRDLYGSVQEFITGHHLGKEKLPLEFRAELVGSDFASQFMTFFSLNKKGSFYGNDDGRMRANQLVEQVDWESKEDVKDFLRKVEQAIHFDLRGPSPVEVRVENQLAKSKTAEELYDYIYSLEFVIPKYVLRWEGKELSMLSPGERGTLLLVFYLLIDRSDDPLVIDQPEGNLDNHTVAKVLVECIKETRRHRQVFIVTHNPNLAVVCDADQIIYSRINKSDGNSIKYLSGSLENPEISGLVTDVLEGTRWAFDVRGLKYDVGAKP